MSFLDESNRAALKNDELETELLAALTLEPRMFWAAREILGGGERATLAFYRDVNRWTWRAMAALSEAAPQTLDALAFDALTVCDWLQQQRGGGDKSILEELGGANALMKRLTSTLALPSMISDYARRLRRWADLRDLRASFSRLAIEAASVEADPDDLMAQAQAIFSQSTTALTKGADTSADRVDHRWEGEFDGFLCGDSLNSTTTGIAALDRLLRGGIHSSRYIVLGGLTKHGKTTLALAIASSFAFGAAGAVDWISVEMNDTELEDRFLAHISNVDIQAFKERCKALKIKSFREIEAAATYYRDERFRAQGRAVADARAHFASSALRIVVDGAPNVRDIEAMIRARRANMRPEDHSIVVVDYLQKLTPSDRRLTGAERLDDISTRLNAISKDKTLNCTVIVLVQFGQDAAKRFMDSKSAPSFSDIKGTSTIAQDANHCLILHRPDIYSKSEAMRSYVEIEQVLSRHGGGGEKIEQLVDLVTSRFMDVPMSFGRAAYGESD